ncbi:MAG: SEL1-like repeat protein [Alphaproteobacteria bacterium]|nr:SEL1-like repeat protein [Alphaproteobacteria bacterium]
MQPELPWNVAGIPAEAREAARAAARREGLSVGEWMTRRILRGFGEGVVEAPANWHPGMNEAPGAASHSTKDSQEMLERVTRSEAEAQNAYKVLDQQLKTVARRLETAERNQTENNRAMTQAATQINIAAREQAQAFEQMSANVTGLAERLTHLERHVQNDSSRDAIKALHQGLSRVADQIAQTANQSAAQIAAVAGNLDSLTTQVVEARERSEGAAQAIESHCAPLDERLRVVERTAFSGASALDHTMEHVERLRAVNDSLEAELRRQSSSVGELRTLIDQFAARVAAAEAETRRQSDSLGEMDRALAHVASRISTAEADARQQSATLDQIQEAFDQFKVQIGEREDEYRALLDGVTGTIAKLQTQDKTGAFEDRLRGIEHALSEIMHRLEYGEHTSASTTAKVEQIMREMSEGFEANERRNHESIRDLQLALHDLTSKLAGVEEKTAVAQAAAEAARATVEGATAAAAAAAKRAEPESPAPQPGQPILDMLPFGEEPFTSGAPNDFVPVAPSQHEDLPPVADNPHELDLSLEPETVFTPDLPPPPFGEPGPAAASESFIAAARRSANAAAAHAEPSAPRASMANFAWTMGKRGSEPEPQERRKRYALAGSIFGVAVTAALAGVVLSHGVGSTPPAHAPSAAMYHPYPASAKVAELPRPATTRNSPLAPDTAANQQAAPVPSAAKTDVPVSTEHKASAAIPAAAKPMPPVTAPASMPSPDVQSSPAEKLAALARSGDSKGQLLLGLKYLEGHGVAVNEAEAARWLARAAQQGEPFAEYRLATLYERGRGVAADAKLAAHWYELAAKQGNRKAMHNLAVAFAEGSGEPKDSLQASMWFARAANLGLADSQFNLAVLYERGMGVKQSLVDAYKWYLIASAQGDAESKTRAEALSTQLSDADRAAAQQAAQSFRPQQPDPAANSIPAFG